MNEANVIKLKYDAIEEYRWLWGDLFTLMLNGNKWCDGLNVYTSGARSCGKTENIYQTLLNLWIAKPYTIIYVVRRTTGQCRESMEQVIETLAKKAFFQNIHIEVNYKELEIRMKNSYNKIKFLPLNPEKLNVQMGGVLGLATKTLAKQICVFFEECCHLNKRLIENLIPTIRGNEKTIKTYFYASNNWVKNNWYSKLCLSALPENEKELDEGPYYQYQVLYPKKEIHFRASYKINPFANKSDAAKWEEMKKIDYEQYKIVALGCAGSVVGGIYARELEKMLLPNIDNIVSGYKYVGVDWGWGATEESSWTTALGVSIASNGEVDVFKEWGQHNYINPMDEEEKKDNIIDFCKEIYEEYGQSVKVYVDNGSCGDFYQTFNSRLAAHGLTTSEVQFFPVNNDWKKAHVNNERAQVVKSAIASGVLRVDTNACPHLMNEFENCHWVDIDKEWEDMNFKRSHEYTHFINALEYGIRDFWVQMCSINKFAIFTKKSYN